MMSTIEIRDAVESDIPALLELCREGFNYDGQFDTTLDLGWPDKRDAIDYFHSSLSDNSKLVLVAVIGERVVGYLAASLKEASYYRKVCKIAELGSMIVTESERGQGIGRSMVMEFFDWCRAKFSYRVRVEATTANIRAIRFYRSCGFEVYSSILEGDLSSVESKS